MKIAAANRCMLLYRDCAARGAAVEKAQAVDG